MSGIHSKASPAAGEKADAIITITVYPDRTETHTQALNKAAVPSKVLEAAMMEIVREHTAVGKCPAQQAHWQREGRRQRRETMAEIRKDENRWRQEAEDHRRRVQPDVDTWDSDPAGGSYQLTDRRK